MEKTKEKLQFLTGLRGIFILMIVIYHMGGYFGTPYSSYLRLLYKWGGVMGNSFFFMLSGFVISYGYKDRILQKQTEFGNFIKKRLSRLYPAYLITNIIQACFLVYEKGPVVNFKTITLNVFMITTGWVDDIYPYNVSCWFISVLLLCYMIYYLICRAARGNSETVFWLDIALALWGYLLLSRGWDIPFCYPHNGEGFLNFFIGCILYEIRASGSQRQNRRLAGGMFCLLIFFLFLSFRTGFERFSGDSRFSFSFLICPAVFLLVPEMKWLQRILENRAAIRLGEISMNIFYWHMPIIVFINILTMKGWFSQISAGIRFLLTLTLILLWSALLQKRPFWPKEGKSKKNAPDTGL